MAVPGTSIAAYAQSGGDIDSYRYSAPEVLWPKDYDRGKLIMTKESDVYGMGMVAYEASFHHPISSGSGVESHASLLGFDGEYAIL